MDQEGLSLDKRAHKRIFKTSVVLATGTLVDNDTTVVDEKHLEEEVSTSSSQSNASDFNVEKSASMKRNNMLAMMATNGLSNLLEETHRCKTSNYACPDCCQTFSTEHEVMVHSLLCQCNAASPLSSERSEFKYSTQEGVEVQNFDIKLLNKDFFKSPRPTTRFIANQAHLLTI